MFEDHKSLRAETNFVIWNSISSNLVLHLQDKAKRIGDRWHSTLKQLTSSLRQSPPALVYGLIKECSRWNSVLTEVIDQAGILSHERKLTPILSLLLVHDLLLARRGIACPSSHPLRAATERHKARLGAELVKARLRRKCHSIDTLRMWVEAQNELSQSAGSYTRWVRINRLKSSLSEELETSFSQCKESPTFEPMSAASAHSNSYYCDQNVPDLICTNVPAKELTDSQACRSGNLVLQDKASCFPAHLLLNSRPATSSDATDLVVRDIIDACAAPGNKTSHIASILATSHKGLANSTIFACERDAKRTETLREMLGRAGADSIRVLPKQDFLALSPFDPRFNKVTHLLLDPSCSGSGILNRDEVPTLTLPKNAGQSRVHGGENIRQTLDQLPIKDAMSRKRKREIDSTRKNEMMTDVAEPSQQDRLRRLSNLQTRIIEHAFRFSHAKVITYSTCSIFAVENEMVALRALNSEIAKERKWRPLRRHEQPSGLQTWPRRGGSLDGETNGQEEIGKLWLRRTPEQRDEFLNACIRCEPGDEGTIGFFVIGFVRSELATQGRESFPKAVPAANLDVLSSDEEWGGFEDD